MSDDESFVRFCERDSGGSVTDREAAYLSEYFEPNDRVLDVGAGIGSIKEQLANYDIVGLDISAEIVRTARYRVGSQFIGGDARTLPITTDAVDAVCFVTTLEFTPEIETIQSEAVRVVRPDGVVAALVLNTRSIYVQSSLIWKGSYFQQIVHR